MRLIKNPHHSDLLALSEGDLNRLIDGERLIASGLVIEKECVDKEVFRWVYADGSTGVCSENNIKFTFDGNTGELKSAEVL